MIGRIIPAIVALLVAAAGTPAPACSVVAQRPICDGGAACTDAVVAQMRRERDQREAIEYGRAMAQAMNARVESPALDRGYDLARILLPNMVLPVALSEDSCVGWTAEDEDSEGHHDSIEEAEAAIRRETGLVPGAPVNSALLSSFATRRLACNAEIRRDLAAYLTSALPRDQLHELWDFLLPRAGAWVPSNGAETVGSGRLLYFGVNGQLAIPDDSGGRETHIDARRERAWHYLAHHRNGRAIMSALNQFVAARTRNGREEAALCPATATSSM
jgi:hypothetical protein